jgi:acetyltransferase
MEKHFLTPLFAPRSVVIFAGRPGEPATQTAAGTVLVEALKQGGYAGTLQFLDTGFTGTLAELAQTRVDLAVIALPPAEIAPALEVAGRLACRSALVVSSGVGAEQAAELARIARRTGMHLLGPNSLGFQRPPAGLNASAAGPLAQTGSLGLVVQSGALTAAMLDWARQNAVGFSAIVSVGPNTQVDVAQVLDFFATDPETRSIIVYLEGISSARRFMSALRAAASGKPVIVLKAGRMAAGNEAARTHSGATVGSDDVFDAALRRAGAVRVRSFSDLFSAAKCLASRNRPVGRRLAVVTNGGGPGVLAADRMQALSLALATLSPEVASALAPQLPPAASLQNLIDLSEEAGPAHYAAAIEAAARDRQVDGILAIYSPKPGIDPADVARAVIAARPATGKPLLTSWMGDASMAAARALLNEAALPTFRTPEAGVGAFDNIASFHQNQRLLLQTPPPLTAQREPDIEGALHLIESVRAERREMLTETESKTLLAAFHIPITQTVLTHSANEAMMMATQLGFPVALKIDSPDIGHKSDVQGVALGIMSAGAAREAYDAMVERVKRLAPAARINGVTVQKMARTRGAREIAIGVVTDDPFGPVIVFGAGGVMTELIADRAMELPPLNQFLAHRLIERARVAETLAEWRGDPAANVDALEQILLRVSEMVCALPQLREMDINPVIVDATGAVAVDARIVVDSARHGVGGRADVYAHLAILPYPTRYEQTFPLRGGGTFAVRPIRPDDSAMLQELVRGLTPESRYMRFASTFSELPPSMLARFTLIDYDREMAMVAIVKERAAEPADGESHETERVVGVSRYITHADGESCEFSLVVADAFNGKGIGSRLMGAIMDAAREKGLAQMDGIVLAHNTTMLKLMKSLGFAIKRYPEDPTFSLVTHAL